MATQVTEPTDDLAFERFKQALTDPGPVRYPRGSVFLAADAPFAEKSLRKNIREGRTTVLVYPDGEERIIASVKPHPYASDVARHRSRGPLDRLRSALGTRFL